MLCKKSPELKARAYWITLYNTIFIVLSVRKEMKNIFDNLNNKRILIVKILLIAVIPLLFIGFDVFESSDAYNKLNNFNHIENTIYERWGSNQGNSRYFIQKGIPDEEQEFMAMYNLIQEFSYKQIPNKEAHWITFIAPKNPIVHEWEGILFDKVILNKTKYSIEISDNYPIILSFCSCNQKIHLCGCDYDNDLIYVGSISDVKRWYYAERSETRLTFHLYLIALSIILGVFAEFFIPVKK